MKKKSTEHTIAKVLPGSIAEELEVEAGDILLSIDGQPVEDIFDYRYLTNEEYLVMEIRKSDGQIWELEIEKEYEDDPGLVFDSPLMDGYRSCSNKCIFCFIDQLPPGMRKTLYFKDDDSRLSFLQGNYVTLTNMSDHDIDRIIMYRLEPINISFHTMNPQLRVKMLRNRFAGDIFGKVQRLADAGIWMNGQIVLCRGVNDGDELEYSLRGFEAYLPALKSISVVPVGLTAHRDGLYPLTPFDREDALQVLSCIHRWQDYYMKHYGTHLVHASDEWYILAGLPLPEAESYDGYLQLENGVGMLRLLMEESRERLETLEEAGSSGKRTGHMRRCSIATGALPAPFVEGICKKILEQFPNTVCTVYTVLNHFFGEMITVSGLLTGRDLAEQLSGRDLGEELLLPVNMLRSGERVFLDDMTVDELSEQLKVPIRIVDTPGAALVDAVLGLDGCVK